MQLRGTECSVNCRPRNVSMEMDQGGGKEG